MTPTDTSSTQVFSYFTDTVFEEVAADLQSQLGYTETQAYNLLYSGGLIIYTTMDPDIQAIVDKMEENADDGMNYSGKCYISQSACMEDAREVARLVEERFPKLNGRVEINYVGTTIGSHTGPGTVALFFWGKERVD